MKRNSVRRAAVILLLAGLWTAGILPAEAVQEAAPAADVKAADLLEEKGLELGESSLRYPALREGAVEEELRGIINDRILEDGHVRDYAARISQLISGGSLRVGWDGAVMGDVFSFAMAAEGAVTGPRPAFVWTAGNIDLSDGHEIAWEELFTDPEAARNRMETYLDEQVAPDLSAHLQNSALSPVPELFALNERGILLLYSMDQLSTLSDRAGDVLIPWSVVRDELILAEGGIPARMGVARWLASDTMTDPELQRQNLEGIQAACAAGGIPGLPLRLGDGVMSWTERQHLLTDPDVYAGGRLFSLEGGVFRNVFLMTDFLSESWDSSVADGIRMDLGSLCGLVIGETEQSDWRQLLGEPEYTIEYDEERAEAYRTVPGFRDYYEFGGHRLQLHADEGGTLVSVILSE